MQSDCKIVPNEIEGWFKLYIPEEINKQEVFLKGGLIVIGVSTFIAVFSWVMNNYIYTKLK